MEYPRRNEERRMSHADTHDHSHGHADTGERPYFPAADWEEFKKADIEAGKAIVLLMGCIFSIGLMLYGIVATVVTVTPQ
jgi:hypothetical protein